MSVSQMNRSQPNVPAPAYEVITPEVASKMLEGNVQNRSLRQAKVDRWAGAMKRGEWTFSNDAITFAPDGTLLNGQHRLWAIFESGVTLRMLVLRNCPAEAMSAMDTGAGRTSGDYFGPAGLRQANPIVLSGAIKQIILIDTERISADRSGQQITNAVMEDWFYDNPSICASVAAAVRHTSGGNRIHCAPRLLAVAHFLIARVNGVEQADEFFNLVATRAGVPSGSPVHALANRLTEVSLQKVNVEPKNMIHLLVRGWNAFAQGKEVTRLPLLNPDPFVIPKVAVRG